jgi:hypothetical protein
MGMVVAVRDQIEKERREATVVQLTFPAQNPLYPIWKAVAISESEGKVPTRMFVLGHPRV